MDTWTHLHTERKRQKDMKKTDRYTQTDIETKRETHRMKPIYVLI